MAKHDSVIAEELRGSMGKATFTKVNGIMVAKKKITYMPQTKSEKVKVQREKWKVTSSIAKEYSNIYEKGIVNLKRGRSKFSAFMTRNLQAVDVDATFKGTFDFEKAIFTNGYDKIPKVKVTFKDNIFRIIQTAQDNRNKCLVDDQVYLALLEPVYEDSELVTLMERGNSGSTTFTMPEDWDIENVKAYAFAVSASGSSSSKTLYVPIIIETE